jgi:S-formylglutathione hydrolase FrmB
MKDGQMGKVGWGESRVKIMIILVLVVCSALFSWAFSQAAAQSARKAPSASAPATPAVTVMSEGCIVERFGVPSPSMKRQIRALVVLPPGYKDNRNQRYPVLYALHGGFAPYACWSEMSPLRRALRQRPMIVASFDGDQLGWYIDATRKPDSKFTTFFFDEFMPCVESRYRTNALRGVTGFSMGGFGALHYMLCKPALFASVSALSSDYFRLSDKAAKAGYDLVTLLGDPDQNKEEYARLDIPSRIEEAVKEHVRLPPMMLYCSTEDGYGLLAENREMARFLVEQNRIIADEVAKEAANQTDKEKRDKLTADLLAARRINFLSMESPGKHEWPFWRDASEIVIDFHWRSFRDAQTDKR